MRGNRNLFQIGEKFGKLTIKRRWTEKWNDRKSKETICECICDCGGICITPARYLRGHKASCGCLQKINNKDHHGWKGHGEISKSFWSDIVRGCKRSSKTIDFNLSIEDAWQKFLDQNRKCALTGVEIGFSQRCNRYGVEDKTASLDRIDSSKGYSLCNVQWVHKTINLMKLTQTQDDFIKWCKLVASVNA